MKVVFKNISIAICLVALAGAAGCSSKENTNDKATESATKAVATSQDSTARKAAVITPTTWAYSEEEDKMTSGKTYVATNTSSDELQFKAPYDGGSNIALYIENKERKNQVLLYISPGQFLTSIMDNKGLRMRFDKNKPITVAYASPSDGSHDWISLRSPDKIISMLKSAKHLIIEVEFYNEGTRQIEFNIAGFKWDH